MPANGNRVSRQEKEREVLVGFMLQYDSDHPSSDSYLASRIPRRILTGRSDESNRRLMIYSMKMVKISKAGGALIKCP
ncbi:MAG TPA: hypothetical protein ENJ87_07130 [Gammaproteobacteria bacterium]|nr:hypothetical protein [Gammaproteobacteria bacterium]